MAVRHYEFKLVKMENEIQKRVKDCIRGSLMAGAAGDALGYPVEFMSRKAIFSHYGDKGITQFKLDRGGKALISDDTQMTLFTANGLLTEMTRSYWKGLECEPENNIEGAYVDWFFTQTGMKGKETCCTWLRDLPELAHNRAPGTTCMGACESLIMHEKPNNYSKGCGGIMRVAPMGLLDASYCSRAGKGLYSAERLAEAGAAIAKATHLHPLGYMPAALMTLLLSRLVSLSPEEAKGSIVGIIEEALGTIMTMEGDEHAAEKNYLGSLTKKAIQLSQSSATDESAIRQLGEGWVAEESWAISLYCALRHIDSMKEAIIAAVNHDGDSDSTGSMTGNIMGAIYGYDRVKQERLFCPAGKEFEDTIELSNIVLALADDLYSGCVVSEHDSFDTPEKKQWRARYIEMRAEGI